MGRGAAWQRDPGAVAPLAGCAAARQPLAVPPASAAPSRPNSSSYYSPLPYAMATGAVEVPYLLVQSFLMVIITYWCAPGLAASQAAASPAWLRACQRPAASGAPALPAVAPSTKPARCLPARAAGWWALRPPPSSSSTSCSSTSSPSPSSPTLASSWCSSPPTRQAPAAPAAGAAAAAAIRGRGSWGAGAALGARQPAVCARAAPLQPPPAACLPTSLPPRAAARPAGRRLPQPNMGHLRRLHGEMRTQRDGGAQQRQGGGGEGRPCHFAVGPTRRGPCQTPHPLLAAAWACPALPAGALPKHARGLAMAQPVQPGECAMLRGSGGGEAGRGGLGLAAHGQG